MNKSKLNSDTAICPYDGNALNLFREDNIDKDAEYQVTNLSNMTGAKCRTGSSCHSDTSAITIKF